MAFATALSVIYRTWVLIANTLRLLLISVEPWFKEVLRDWEVGSLNWGFVILNYIIFFLFFLCSSCLFLFLFLFLFFLWVTSHYPALWDWNNPLNNVCAFIFTSKCLYWVTIHCTGLYIVEVTSKRRNKGVSQEIPASYTFLLQEAFNSNKRQRE